VKILITGGAGFIGSAVCRFLVLQSNASVVNVDKLTYAGSLSSLGVLSDNPRYKFVRADICDAPTMQDLLDSEKPNAILHLAAETHVDRSITGASAFIDTNIVGTYRLLEVARFYLDRASSAVRNTFRFVHVSTDEVYGSLGADGYFREDTAYDPSSPYSASKAAADHLTMAWHRTYGLPVIISNCSNNYGPYQFPEKLIPLTILHAIERKPLPVYGNGLNVRDWLYVEDHAQALDLIIRKGTPGHKYNVGGFNERTNIAVVKKICEILDRLAPSRLPYAELITFVPDRPGHDQRYAIDASKVQQELGWKAREPFDTGLEKTVAWYLKNEWWWGPLRERTYAGERLGLVERAPDKAAADSVRSQSRSTTE
jgi:dTDP-glucose 4,6-dehydratase